MHANRLLGRDPLMGRLCPGAFQRWCVLSASLHSMHWYLVSGASPFWCWRCGLRTLFLSFYYYLGYRGLHAPTVPPPSVSPPPRLLLPVGIMGGHLSGIGTFLVLSPVNARGWVGTHYYHDFFFIYLGRSMISIN